MFSNNCRRIVVATQDLAYGLCRVYEGYRDLPESRFFLFRTLPGLERNPSPLWASIDPEKALAPAG